MAEWTEWPPEPAANEDWDPAWALDWELVLETDSALCEVWWAFQAIVGSGSELAQAYPEAEQVLRESVRSRYREAESEFVRAAMRAAAASRFDLAMEPE